MIHPDFSRSWESLMEGILPIYSLTKGLTQREMRLWQSKAIDILSVEIKEIMPRRIIEKHRLCSLEYALKNIHFPGDKQKLKEARFRLIFDELFILQLALFRLKSGINVNNKQVFLSKDVNKEDYIKTLPFSLTEAQTKVVNQISRDLRGKTIMNRLVQGDVGSGKTIIAEIALYEVCKSGYQGVLMAPTEILAVQHYKTMVHRFADHGLKVGLLTGSLSAKNKKQVLDDLESGEINILIGTHALIQAGVEFKNLGLVVTDEQHRFGVNQRNLLTKKGGNPEVMVMTATPIPRTLAGIIYGDLDISIIDQLPPGRQKIITKSINETSRTKAYAFLREQVKQGRQAYIVSPLIEDSPELDVRSAESLYQEVSRSFKNFQVALIHGAMKQGEKDAIMEAFYSGEISILVSTVVIEVGVNVPNASIMIVENAERFGLAQLHQLRGRVGRGTAQSYCILVTGTDSKLATERADILVNSTDGFFIAEEDLRLRGPGEFFGTRQHGLPDLKIADLVRHMAVFQRVRDDARDIFEMDPYLQKDEHMGLGKRVEDVYRLSVMKDGEG